MILFHRDLGGEGRPPLVILHGFLGSSRNWNTAGRDLAASFHVLALDLRNHGASPHADGMGYPALVDDVLETMDSLELERTALMGHSLGGKVAMLLACRHPGRVERLTIVDIAPKAYHWPERRLEFEAMRNLDLATLNSRTEAEARIEEGVPDWAMRKFLLTNLERDSEGKWKWIINLPVLAAAVDDLEANPLAADDRYSGPVRFVLGGKSSYVRAEDFATITKHFPAARIETIASAGHNPHMETRERFLKVVTY